MRNVFLGTLAVHVVCWHVMQRWIKTISEFVIVTGLYTNCGYSKESKVHVCNFPSCMYVSSSRGSHCLFKYGGLANALCTCMKHRPGYEKEIDQTFRDGLHMLYSSKKKHPIHILNPIPAQYCCTMRCYCSLQLL